MALQRNDSTSARRDQDFSIFTSIRYDTMLSTSQDNEDYSNRRRINLYMPELHRQRLWKAAANFWPKNRYPELETTTSFETALLRAFEEREMLHETYMCPMKLKYSFTQDGRTALEIAPVPALSMKALFPTTFRLPSESRTPTKGGRFSSSSSSPMASPRFSPSYAPSSPSRPTTARSTSEDYFSSGSSTHGSSEGSSSRKRTELPCTYEIWVDTAPTGQTNHTSFKSSLRECYNNSRQRALPVPSDMTQEVLLFNGNGLITEGSVLTPYFYRNRKWITPAVESSDVGGQQGTTRRWALERGLAEEGQVERRSIRVGERVWLSNGVRGFGWGRIMATKRGDNSSISSGTSI